MKTKYRLLMIVSMLLSINVMAQSSPYVLDEETNGTTVTITPGESFSVLDDGGLERPYSAGYDYSITIPGT